MVKIFLSQWIVPSCCAGGHYNWRLSVDFDVAKDHRKQRFIQSQPYPRKCLTSSSSQALECDKRLWPFDPEHEPTCVQHATDHLIVRNFTSLVLVHKTIFDRLPFLLASYWQFISLKRWPDDSDSVSLHMCLSEPLNHVQSIKSLHSKGYDKLSWFWPMGTGSTWGDKHARAWLICGDKIHRCGFFNIQRIFSFIYFLNLL